jgi:TPR repeat protein
MTPTQKVLCIACSAALLFVSDLANSQRSSELSADLPDSRTMATQDKVDALFDTGDYERAFFIYRNELAPIGDKYAQYMVGYMYLTGMGVEEDRIAASAWYRLSAERGTAEFIAVRDRLMRNMNENEVRLSDAQYNQLRFEYCDLAVLLSSIKRNFKEVETKTGSRIQSESNAMMTIIDRGGGRVRSGAEYYGVIHTQLEDRLKLLQEIGDFQDMDTDPEKVNLRELERNVKDRIASFN